MSFATLVLGESGTGKTCSLRNLDPAKCLLIQPVFKPLPFPSKGWKRCLAKGDGGNIFVSDNPAHILKAMEKTDKEVIVLDDFQYIIANMYMKRRMEKGFDKFTDIAGSSWDLANMATLLAPNKRVYILAHTQTDEHGKTRIKTIGKMLDEKLVLEGLFTTVLRTRVGESGYQFSTHNSGSDTVKSPMGLFKSDLIENDLAEVDARIVDYYGIEETQPEESTTTDTEEIK